MQACHVTSNCLGLMFIVIHADYVNGYARISVCLCASVFVYVCICLCLSVCLSLCVQEYEEYLLSEGLITDDMSERIVTSLPKCLSDSTMRGSRESLSLRGSCESVHSSTDSLCQRPVAASCEDVSAASSSDAGGVQRRRRRRRGHWQLLRRAVTRWIDSQTKNNINKHRYVGHVVVIAQRHVSYGQLSS